MAWYENLVIEAYDARQEVDDLLASYEALWDKQKELAKANVNM